MNVPRGSLFSSILGLFVLAAGCQDESSQRLTDAPAEEGVIVTEDDTIGVIKDETRDETKNETKDDAENTADSTLTSCLGKTDSHGPNNKRSKAIDAPAGVTSEHSICSGDEDWFRIAVPANNIVRVGIEMDHAAGDLDLVVYDANGQLVGSRYGRVYPYSSRESETNTEFYGLYAEENDKEYFVRVVGHSGAQNVYSLHVDQFPYVDGESCTGAGFSVAECLGQGTNGSGLLPFPFPDANDSNYGAGYEWESLANYRFARRELIMLVRHALAETLNAFPQTTPLSLLDVCQKDGITPGYDVGDPRHPESTHDQGGNIDIAYFQTDGANDGEIVCGDGAQHADGFCTAAAKTKHIVDLPRQAFFMAKLFASPRTRVVGTDTVLAPLIADAARVLAALPKGNPKRISADELAGFSSKMASGNGWPYHHHHIHLSMNWWSAKAFVAQGNEAFQSDRAVHSMVMPEFSVHSPSSGD